MPRDLTAAVRAVFDVVFGASADARWDEAAALLDPRGHDLRAWLRSGFFERHLKLYSKSRRKAPILWQLGTPSGRYSVWLYAHRLTNDSLFQLQNDVLAPKLAYEERQLTNLVQSSGGSPSARERREIEAQERFVEELRVLLEEVKRVAPLWRPTLDDGIVLVMAPLWRLVPHKPWQRELKKKWSELAAGKYDWAQLAMHLWPERVVPKCGDDRSLAIAHGLEDVFWIEDEDGKWQPRQEPTTARERPHPGTHVGSGQRRTWGARMNLLYDYLCAQLDERLAERRVVVFYDPRSEFAPLFDRELQNVGAGPNGLYRVFVGERLTLVARYDGSFFAVRAAVEDIVAEDEPDPLLIYVPGVARDPNDSVLMELEKGGSTYEPQLKRHARTLLRQFYTDGAIDDMLAPESLTYDDVVSYLEQARAGDQGSILKSIFGGASSELLLTRWLADESHDQEIVAKQALSELLRLIEARLGLSLLSRHLGRGGPGEDCPLRARQRVPSRPFGRPAGVDLDDRVAGFQGAAESGSRGSRCAASRRAR